MAAKHIGAIDLHGTRALDIWVAPPLFASRTEPLNQAPGSACNDFLNWLTDRQAHR